MHASHTATTTSFLLVLASLLLPTPLALILVLLVPHVLLVLRLEPSPFFSSSTSSRHGFLRMPLVFHFSQSFWPRRRGRAFSAPSLAAPLSRYVLFMFFSFIPVSSIRFGSCMASSRRYCSRTLRSTAILCFHSSAIVFYGHRRVSDSCPALVVSFLFFGDHSIAFVAD